MLPQLMDTPSPTSPYFFAYMAAQVKYGDAGFLSRDISVRDMLLHQGDKHHVYPREYLKRQGLDRARYNRIANFVVAQTEINIAIGDKSPANYFHQLINQCHGGPKVYGNITDIEELRKNLAMHSLPESLLSENVPSYDDFLDERRHLMALKVKRWFESL